MKLTVHVSLAELNRILDNRQHDVAVYATSDRWWIETTYVTFVARLASALCALLIATHAHASTLAVEPFADVVRAAPVVVRGTVGSAYAAPGPMTCHMLNVVEAVKGTVPPRIPVCQPGGRVGDGRALSGDVDLNAGEEVVLLLRSKDGRYFVHNAAGGKLHVEPSGVVIGEGPNIDRVHGKHSRAWRLEDVRAAAK